MASHNSPISPTASFYDMSDDEEGEYNTVLHKKTGRGVKLLYTKSKVYVHPSPSAKDNIVGFIALIQQKPAAVSNLSGDRPTSSSSSRAHINPAASDILLAWVPESSLGDAYDTYVKVDLSETSSPPKQSFLVPAPPLTTSRPGSFGHGAYAFSVPVSEVYSLLVRPPNLGWWFGSVVINTKAGDSFPALFFHDSECQSTILQRKRLARESFDPFKDGGGMFWGGDEVLRWLKKYVKIERAGADPNIYLIDPSVEDKKGFAKMAGIDDKQSSAPPMKSGESSSRDGAMDPVTKFLKETRWNVLEKLSQVTTFTRRTAQAVAENKNLPPQVRRLLHNPEVQTLQEEFDSARLYLARWAMGIAEQSEKERNQRMWTAKDALDMETTDVGEFEILEAGNLSISDRRQPLTLEEWNGFFNSVDGRLHITVDEVQNRIFHGGLDPEDGVRKEAWLFLLGVYEWSSTKDDRAALMNSKRDEYIRLKGAWWERMADGTAATLSSSTDDIEWWREQKNRIGMIAISFYSTVQWNANEYPNIGVHHVEKDVHRTDRQIPLFAGEDIPHPDPDSPFADTGTNVHLEQMKDMLLTYNEYNKELGYVQGMSDLLAPIYAVMQDDAIAFWGFVGFMARMERNFLRDQSGMRTQLLTFDHLVQLMDPRLYQHLQRCDSTNFFFFFRMLLVWYKREFAWMDILRLWECLWTDWLSSNFHLFIALAILEKHRNVIMDHLRGFDEVLKYINELSNTIDLESTLVRAEQLFRKFQRTVEAVDRRNHFPIPGTASTLRPVPNQSSASDASPGGREHGTAMPSNASSHQKQLSSDFTSFDSINQQKTAISSELRDLLKRDVFYSLGKNEVKQHGGGVGS